MKLFAKNNFNFSCLIICILTFQGCIAVNNVRKPESWPPIAKHDNTEHWSGYIPVNSLQQLSEVYQTPELLTYQQKGYKPYLHVQGVWIADLAFVNSTIMDTVPIWTTIQKGPFKWDKLIKVTAKISNDEIVLTTKYPSDNGGGNPFLGLSRDYIKIYKTGNEDLLICKGSKMFGTAFILFPVYAHFSKWYKYENDKN